MKYPRIRLAAAGLLFALILLAVLAVPAGASHLARRALCDVRVLYLFDDPDKIDWPTLYYLNDRYGCRIDLASFAGRAVPRAEELGLSDAGIFLHRFWQPEYTVAVTDSLLNEMFKERRPDVVIIGDLGRNEAAATVAARLTDFEPDQVSLFNIVKVYRAVNPSADSATVEAAVLLNSNELATRYRLRMEREIPQLFDWYQFGLADNFFLSRYQLTSTRLKYEGADADFLAGMQPLRLIGLIDSLFTPGPRQETHKRQATQYVTKMRGSLDLEGQQKVQAVLDAYKELQYLKRPGLLDPADDVSGYRAYLGRLMDRAERAALVAAGVNYDGRLILRDSPHGPKVKFRVSLSVDGPREVNLSDIRFEPYWDTMAVALEKGPLAIAPHQSYVREFLVDIDRERLETQQPESLLFAASIEYSGIPVELRRILRTRTLPGMDIHFDPPFYFVPPVANLDIDRVVSSMAWNIVIDKPRDFGGTVKLNLQTPRGVFAGAYRTELRLDKGSTTGNMRIPFTVSNLFENGLQQSTISLIVDGQTVASHTGIMRIARCEIDDRTDIGFLPDPEGLLEDVLRLTGASFQPLTDRTLQVADLTAYDVIVIGSNALAEYPSFANMGDRLQEYLRYGGSIVLFGQEETWPDGVLPFSVAPFQLDIKREEIANPIPGANILSKPYKITGQSIIDWFQYGLTASPAVVSPAEDVFTVEGATLLSVSRLGEGQLIYCGLPVLQLIRELDLDAIHLFANLMNY
ncbi:MAG TPA: hypothetical protein PLF13_04375 [candidate division Zixibacteria bacterium]|nr:hypothetical protein [candidate division Zixibacteria bacterium]